MGLKVRSALLLGNVLQMDESASAGASVRRLLTPAFLYFFGFDPVTWVQA